MCGSSGTDLLGRDLDLPTNLGIYVCGGFRWSVIGIYVCAGACVVAPGGLLSVYTCVMASGGLF